MSNQYFDREVRDAKWKQNLKQWHKHIQIYSGYWQKMGLLDINGGPVANPDDFIKAMDE